MRNGVGPGIPNREPDSFWRRTIQKRVLAEIVVSPDEMNRALRTVIVAPITSTIRPWATRCTIRIDGKPRSVAHVQPFNVAEV